MTEHSKGRIARMAPRDAARDYIQRGWEPIPMTPRDKKTKFKWKVPRTWSDEDIEIHFSDDANVGIALGPRSGTAVCCGRITLGPING